MRLQWWPTALQAAAVVGCSPWLCGLGAGACCCGTDVLGPCMAAAHGLWVAACCGFLCCMARLPAAPSCPGSVPSGPVFFIASRTATTTITGVLGEHAADGHVRRSWRPSLPPLLPFMCWLGRGLRPACSTFRLRSASGTLVEFRGGDVVFPPLRRNCDDFT